MPIKGAWDAGLRYQLCTSWASDKRSVNERSAGTSYVIPSRCIPFLPRVSTSSTSFATQWPKGSEWEANDVAETRGVVPFPPYASRLPSCLPFITRTSCLTPSRSGSRRRSEGMRDTKEEWWEGSMIICFIFSLGMSFTPCHWPFPSRYAHVTDGIA